MRTKISLALGKREALSRQTAKGCLTANLAVPGSGSLAAGRIVGYFQLAVYLAGFAMTLLPGIPACLWMFKNYARLQEIEPPEELGEIWVHFRWPCLGIALFVVTLLWALTTSLSILAEARGNQPAPGKKIPPILNQPKPSQRLPPKLH